MNARRQPRQPAPRDEAVTLTMSRRSAQMLRLAARAGLDVLSEQRDEYRVTYGKDAVEIACDAYSDLTAALGFRRPTKLTLKEPATTATWARGQLLNDSRKAR